MPIARKKGYKHWVAVFSVKGQRYARSTPYPSTERNRRAAEKWAEEERRNVKAESVCRIETVEITLFQARELYFADHAKNKNLKAQKRMDCEWKLLMEGGLNPDLLTSELLLAHLIPVKAQIMSRKPSTTNNAFNHLRSILRHASIAMEAVEIKTIQWGKLKRKEPPRKETYLTKEEFWRLHDEIQDHLKPLLLFAVSSGLRLQNVLDLRWSQVDLKKRRYFGVRGKGDKLLSGPLSPSAIQALEQAKGDIPRIGSAHVWLRPEVTKSGLKKENAGKPLKDIRRAFDNAVERSGVPRITFHDLRHTFAVWYLQCGGKQTDLKELMHHEDIATTHRYGAIVDVDVARDLDQMSDDIMISIKRNYKRN